MNDNETMDILLAAYLLGETSAEEEQKVLAWINESAENKKRFYEFRLIWNESKKLAPQISIDVDDAWKKFETRTETKQAGKTIPIYRWMRAAAGLLLLAGASYLSFKYLSQEPVENLQLSSSVIDSPDNIPPNTALATAPVISINEPTNEVVAATPETTITNTKKPPVELTVATKEPEATPAKNPFNDDCKTKKFICNSTPCPIEICIIQKNNCETGKTTPIFNCSIIQPDEAGRLCYKAQGDEKLYANCALVIQEIRIKRISTGETIVLTPHSQPLSAQEAFSYITGQKRGDIVAGVFQNDCNDVPGDNSLTIDNQYGSLLFR